MATTFIEPSSLDADAVVPQASDNQFVSSGLFTAIISRNTDFNDENVREEKRRAVHGELIRSLVYGSQTVINRAYLHNNYGIYHNFTSENADNANAFAQLLRDRSIVPFLYMENELSIEQIKQEQQFTKDEQGVAALENLIDITGDMTVTGFPKGHANLALIGKKFRDYMCSLKRLEPELAQIMCDELFPDEKSDDVQRPFEEAIHSFGSWADGYLDKNGKLSREIIYDNHFVQPKSNVAHGKYRKKGDARLQFAIKKIVDLKYNSNMPDAIGRYTFTPHAMPTRSALADDFQIGKHTSSDVESLISNKLTSEFARRFQAATSKAMYLPFLGELSMRDAVEIRALESRKNFIDRQRTIISNPLSVSDNLVPYQDSFEAFQRELSDWYVKKYKRDPMERRFENFATIGIRFGGHILIYGVTQGLGDAAMIETALANTTWEMAQDKVKGVAVKLMLKVYDHVNNRFDNNLSFSIEVLRSEASYTADEIRALVEKIESESTLAKELILPAEADTN